MEAIRLRKGRNPTNSVQQKWDPYETELAGQIDVHLFEGMNVFWPIVSRKRHACQYDLGAGLLQSFDHLGKITARRLDGLTAKSVITPELENDDCGFERQDGREALKSICRRVTADAGIHDMIVETFHVEEAL